MATFFYDISNPLCDQAKDLATTMSSNIVAAVVPVIVSALAVMILFYGLSVVRGEAQQPAAVFFAKILKIAIITAIVQEYSSNSVNIINLAWTTQDNLVQAVSGSSNAFQAIDSATTPLVGFFAGLVVFMISSTTSGTGESLMMALLIVCFVVLGGGSLALCVFYALLSKVGLGVVLGLGPLFIAGLAFGPTARFFDSWLAAVLNFCLLSAVSSVMLGFVTQAQSAAISYSGLNILLDAILLILFGIVTLLCMMEVPRLTASLTGGADMTGGVGAYAVSRTAYGESWLSSISGRNRGSRAAAPNGSTRSGPEAGAVAAYARGRP